MMKARLVFGTVIAIGLTLMARQTAAADAAGKGDKPAHDAPAPGADPAAPNGGTPAGGAKAKEIASLIAGAAEAAKDESKFPRSGKRSCVTGKAEIKLYFLPDGEPVDPLPADLSERDDISLYVVVPSTMRHAARFDVTACPARDLQRVNGDFAAAKKIVSAQSFDVNSYVAQPLGKLRCGAGQVSFHVGLVDSDDATKEAAGASHTLTLGPVYWGSVGVQFAFDFTKSGTLGVETGPAGSVITRSDDLLGPKVSPMFLWHPFGLDPEHVSVLGLLVNPSLGFDLDAITTSFFVGDSLCWNGLCLTGGAHIRKTDQLTRTSGLSEGDMFDTTMKVLPVEKRWTSSNGGIGFFGAIVLDVTTAAKIIGGSK